MPSRSSQEYSPPCQGGDHGFKSHRGRCENSGDGTIRKPAKRPSSNLGELWVRLPLVPVTFEKTKKDRVVLLTAACKAVAMNCGAVGERFDSFITQFASGSVVYWQGHRPLKAEKGVRLPSELLKSQSVWLRRDWCPAGSHKAGSPGSIPGPEIDKKSRSISSNPSFTLMARYANWHSDQVENLMSVGSTPTRATHVRAHSTNESSCGPAATTPLLQRGNGGSIPSGTTRGFLVFV